MNQSKHGDSGFFYSGIEIARPRLMRRRRDDGGDDGGGGVPLDLFPPAIAFQFGNCFEGGFRTKLIDSMKGYVQSYAPNSEVISICVGGKEKVGVWLSNDNLLRANREKTLIAQNLYGQLGESFAAYFGADFLRIPVQSVWDNLPKRLTEAGNIDPNGPIHLTGFDWSTSYPNVVTTVVSGYDETPWPDVSFTLSVTEALSVAGDEIHCQTQRKLDVDTSLLNTLTGIFSLIFPPLGLLFGAETFLAGDARPPEKMGVGCGIAGLIPRSIAIAGTNGSVRLHISRLSIVYKTFYFGSTYDVII